MKQFETALQSAGVELNDVDQLTFALFRTEKNGLKVIGVANGQFSPKAVLAKFKKQKVAGQKYKLAHVFPLSGMQMAFLDDYTMLFGDMPAIKAALDARNGDAAVPEFQRQSQRPDRRCRKWPYLERPR